MGPSRGLALLVCMVAALGAAVPARAAWEPVERPVAPAALEGPLAETDLGPAIAVSPAGERLLAWTGDGKVEVASRSPGAPWTSPATISGVGPELYMGASAGFEPSGQARVSWGEGPKWPPRQRESTRGADGLWGDASDVADPFPVPDPYATLLTGPGGHQAFVWSDYIPPTGLDLMVATRSPGEDWSSPRRLSDPGGRVDAPDVALDAQGDAIAVWDGDHSVASAFLPSGGDWSAPRTLSTAYRMTSATPGVAFDSAGNALAVWNEDGTLRAAYRPAGGDFGAPQVLSTHGGPIGLAPAQIAFDAAGRATVLWQDGSRIAVGDRPPGGTFDAATLLTPPDVDGGNARLAVLPDGTTFVLAEEHPQGGVVVYTRPAGGSFDGGTTLAAEGVVQSVLASNGLDSVAVAWVRRYPRLGCAEIETAGWERSGPASPAPAREPCPGFESTAADPPPPTFPPPPGPRPRSAAHDTVAPTLKLYAPQRERTLTTGRLALKAWSDEACRLVLTARLVGHGGHSLGRAGSALQARRRSGLTLRLTGTGARRLKRALGRQARGRVRLTVSATDASGNRRAMSKRIVLTR